MSTESYEKLVVALCKFIERASSPEAEIHEVQTLPRVVDALVTLLRFRAEDDNYYVIENLKNELKKYKENGLRAESGVPSETV